ncbi:hypothetical protein VHP8226_00799 [Vibrio hippocampi]|uniref:MerR family transcriptional regulator n=2 Tax=Vibrio hippocampi TaxID=654686 RepID=A0ABN8DDS9_9VIBR|nr:hypothetical protein VHP8226_00799 [Vibrio hippocampi]
MPLDGIKQYAELRHQGDTTLLERKQLLEQHRRQIEKEIEKQKRHLSALDAKIHVYELKIDA